MIPLLEKHERFPHRDHQLVGVEQLTRDVDLGRTAEHAGITYTRELPNVFALFDEVGAGKTKQIVDTSQLLYLDGKVDTMMVVAPGEARMTWAEEDPVLGEVAKHAWEDVPNVIHEFHRGYTELEFEEGSLNWVVSNFEFIRMPARLASLLKQLRHRKVWLVIDESWNVCHYSQQMRACLSIRKKRADRVTLLNGTPLADGRPADLYYQFAMLDPEIIGAQNRTHFRSKYCVMGGYQDKQVIAYQNLDELNARIAPYVLTRRTRDCFDLPPMLDPIILEARLKPDTWKLYKGVRDDMVAWLGDQVSLSSQAIVKVLRLAQLTSGYLGGLEDTPSMAGAAPPPWMKAAAGIPDISLLAAGPSIPSEEGPITKEVGSEKLDALMKYLRGRMKSNLSEGDTPTPNPAKLLVWCRFRPELERAALTLGSIYDQVRTLKGGQTSDERAEAKLLLAPDGDPRPAAVVANHKVGGSSLNLAGCSMAIYLSNGMRLLERTQTIGRIERKGQLSPMQIVDVVATGPKGQKTIDHHVLKALRKKEDMSAWTVNEWRRVLTEE